MLRRGLGALPRTSRRAFAGWSHLAAHHGLGLCRVTLCLPLARRGGAIWRPTADSRCAELHCVCRWPRVWEPAGGAPRARVVPSYAAFAVGRACGSQLAALRGLGLCRVTLRLPVAARGGASWRRTGGSGCAGLRCVCRWPCARGASWRCTAGSGLCRVTLRLPVAALVARAFAMVHGVQLCHPWLRCALGVGRVSRRTGGCLFYMLRRRLHGPQGNAPWVLRRGAARSFASTAGGAPWCCIDHAVCTTVSAYAEPRSNRAWRFGRAGAAAQRCAAIPAGALACERCCTKRRCWRERGFEHFLEVRIKLVNMSPIPSTDFPPSHPLWINRARTDVQAGGKARGRAPGGRLGLFEGRADPSGMLIIRRHQKEGRLGGSSLACSQSTCREEQFAVVTCATSTPWRRVGSSRVANKTDHSRGRFGSRLSSNSPFPSRPPCGKDLDCWSGVA